MRTGTTKEIRKLLRDVLGLKPNFITTVVDPNVRILGYHIGSEILDVMTQHVNDLLTLNEFDNQVYNTGNIYLRVKTVIR